MRYPGHMAANLELNLPQTARLEVVEAGEQRRVFVNGYLVAGYPCQDKATERILVTQFAEVLPLRDQEIAAVFGLHAVSLSRFRSQLRTGGVRALLPRRSGPQQPSKMRPRLAARCRQLRAEGLSTREIARRVSRPGRGISHVTVAALFKGEPAPPEPSALLLPELAEAEAHPAVEVPTPVAAELAAQEAAEAPALEHQLVAAPGVVAEADAEAATFPNEAARKSRYAGALLLYAALGRLDLWGVFRQLGAATGPARWYGWAQAVAIIIVGFALRFRSIEDIKNALREDLGLVIGAAQSPSVLALRGKIQALVDSVDPVAVARELFRRYLALEPVWGALYYVDGHFCPYYGKQPTPKGWDAKRRLALKGHTDVYLHDCKGRALFFLSQPLNDSLGRAIPAMVQEIRRVHGPEPFTLVFDRGGYNGDAFRYLQEHGMGFITYLRGRKARRRYPEGRFQRAWFAFEGQRHVYRLMEKKTRVSKVGKLRTILFLGDERRQVPVLTNLHGSVSAARVVHCLQLRWRQENSFKYLTEHYAIDQIIQYGGEPEQQTRLVPNPRRKALKERLRLVNQQIQNLEAQLGRAVDQNDEGQRRTARGLKIAHARLRRDLAERRQVLSRLENRLRHTPGQIAATAVAQSRSLLREDRRLLVNSLKLVAYNAEKLLADRFNQHYQQPKDARSIFRALLQLPGEVHAVAPNRLEVRLARPNSEKVARALQAFLREVNQEQPRLLGNGPVLSFSASELT